MTIEALETEHIRRILSASRNLDEAARLLTLEHGKPLNDSLKECRYSADVIDFSEKGSSVSKGETLIDTARNIEAMGVDVIVIRHQVDEELAGDWVDEATLDALEERSRRLVGVWGNNDGPGLRARLPEVARVELDGVRFAMVHETGPAAGREARCAADYPDADVLVFGHSHIPWDTVAPTGLRLLNPGSPTDRRRQPVCTFMRAVADGGALRGVELVPVDRV